MISEHGQVCNFSALPRKASNCDKPFDRICILMLTISITIVYILVLVHTYTYTYTYILILVQSNIYLSLLSFAMRKIDVAENNLSMAYRSYCFKP